MQDETPNSPYGTNFEEHPILSKLSTFDRIAFSAELATEVNLAYAKGFNAALVQLGNMIAQVGERGAEAFTPNTHAVLMMVYNMINAVNEHFLNLYQNQDKADDPNT